MCCDIAKNKNPDVGAFLQGLWGNSREQKIATNTEDEEENVEFTTSKTHSHVHTAPFIVIYCTLYTNR
jgi:hypothetical protein